MNEAVHPLSQAIHVDLTAQVADRVQEAADVKAWLRRISEAREFDKAARKQYALDRKYARGDAGDFEVDVPIAGVYVDILTSFLYARDPDVDVQPGDGVKPPPMSELIEQVRQEVMSDPAVLMQVQQAGVAAANQAMTAAPQVDEATGQPLPAPQPEVIAQQAQQQAMAQALKSRAEQLLAPYRQQQKDAKQFCSTLEVVLSKVWRRAALKAQMDYCVRSGLTVALGWIKASWQDRMGEDPVIRQQINDIQDNLAGIAAVESDLAEGEGDEDENRAELERQIKGLEGKVEVVIARGMVFDFYPAEDVQVATECRTIAGYKDSPWLATRTFMACDDAEAAFPEIADKLKNASLYHQVQPTDPGERRESGGLAGSDLSAEDADGYKMGAAGSGKGSVCVWEVQDKDSSTVFAVIEGLDCYAVKPYAPVPSSRFYNLFLWSPVKVDGERHPQSLITRSARLLDEYNRTRSNYAEHRRRCLPKSGFDSTNYEKTEIDKLVAGGIGEMVPLKPVKPGSPIREAVVDIGYPAVDMALYDTSAIRAELEMIWGIQEALSSSIRTAKTATEAEIQQSGTQARTGYMRESLDAMLSELAEFTAETVLQKMDRADAVALAGQWAFWPEGMTVEDLGSLVNVSIRAGSSGKPDTNADREAWAAVLPVLQNSVQQVGQLRQSDPAEVADCIEELAATTMEKAGVRLDVSMFMPAAPAASQQMAPQQPQAPQQQQPPMAA